MTDGQRSAEYDAFGPWVLRVTAPEEVPRVFRGAPVDLAGARVVLKVPRDVARRDATPDMHLYDRLLVLDDDGLEVRTRHGDDVAVDRIPAAAVLAVDVATELLQGRLAVHGTDGTALRVPFSASSAAMMIDLADHLVAMTDDGPGSAGPGDRLALDALGDADVGLVKAYLRASSARPGLHVLAAYPGASPRSKESLPARLRPGRLRLSGAVLSADDRHLVTLSRRRWLHRQTRPDVSDRRVVVVRSRISGVGTVPHPRARGVVAATIEGGGGRIALAVPDDAAAALTAASARADGIRGRSA